MTYNRHLVRAFELVFRPWMHRRVSAMHVRGTLHAVPSNRPVLVVSNHTSWWDAFLIRELHRIADTGRPLFTLMDEAELARYPFFRKMGVLGISPHPATIRRAIRTLQNQRNPFWVTLFAQGSIWPSWKRPLAFRKGVELFSRALAPCAVLPVSLHLEAMTKPAPAAFVGIGKPVFVEEGASVSSADIETTVERLLDNLILVLAEQGERAASVWNTEAYA